MSASRVPAGVPTGGQFATSARAESTLTLDPAAAPTLNVATGVDLPPLAFCSATGYDPDLFKEPRNDGWIKPQGGLWLSYLDEEGTTGWATHLIRSRYTQKSAAVVDRIALAPDARVLKIDSREDFLAARSAYRAPDDNGPDESGQAPNRFVDFEGAAADFDAIWVTRRGLNTNSSVRDRPGLYSWDLPSVLVLNSEAIRRS